MRTYVSITLRNVAVSLGIRNVTCAYTHGAELAVGHRSEIEKRFALTAPGRAKGLGENGAGPSVGGGGERGIFKHGGQGQARWAFRAGDLEVTEYIACIRSGPFE